MVKYVPRDMAVSISDARLDGGTTSELPSMVTWRGIVKNG
jgi:hypothetical protein